MHAADFMFGLVAAPDPFLSLPVSPHFGVCQVFCFILYETLIASPSTLLQTYPPLHLAGILSGGLL